MRALLLALLAIAAGLPAAAYTARTNFVLHCSGCHGQDGAGSQTAGVPDLRGYIGGLASTPAGRHYLMHVPGVANTPIDAQALAKVMNYLLQAFADPNGTAPADDFTTQEVQELRARPLDDLVGARRDVARDLRAKGVPVASYPWE